MSDNNDLLQSLYNIVGDLWGSEEKPGDRSTYVKAGQEADAFLHGRKDVYAPEKAQETSPKPVEAPEAPAQEPLRVAEAKPAQPTLSDLWTTADTPVDWTDALVKTEPDDGVTPQKKWSYLHQMAPDVLHGDLKAYKAVIDTLDPLDELRTFTLEVGAEPVNADELQAWFLVDPACMQGENDAVYPAVVALRIARDLFALLPVKTVSVEARSGSKVLMKVALSRKQATAFRFGFADPAAFVRECGAQFPEEEKSEKSEESEESNEEEAHGSEEE